MLGKCKNPLCSTPFRHLADGRLFRLETGQTVGSSDDKATEYFWLCGPCSTGMTLHLAQDGEVEATELGGTLHTSNKIALISLHHKDGRSLRSVSFLPNSHPRGT